MKGTIAIAVIAAFVAATLGAPTSVYNTTIDWQAIDNKVEEIRTVVKDGSSRVGSIATDDNAEVGPVLIEKMTVHVKLSHATLGKIKEQIKAQTMTGSSFSALFKEITDIFETLRTDLSNELAQLSATAQAQISDTLTTSLNQALTKEQNILALLEAPPATQAVDWRAVDTKVEELRAGITAAVADVRSTAIADNPAVGSIIAQKLNVAAGRANEVLGRAKRAIGDQTLTVDQARALFQELQGILEGLQTELRDQVNQLSPAAQEHIRNTLASANDQATAKAQEILALLGAAISTLVPDWRAVDTKVEELRAVITTAVADVRSTAIADNPAVGSIIAQKLNVAAGRANEVLGRAKRAIGDQTLTVDQARALFQELQGILEGLQTELRDQVNQLSPAAQEHIRNTLASANDQATAKAQEILALLGAVFTSRVVDWVAADAKTEEFRRIVNSAVSTVRATAMADNPIVGQQIAQRLNAASSQTNAAIGRAKEAIKAQTWTRAEAEALFGELQTILDGVQTDLRDQVNQLSPAAQEQIINTLNLARSQAEAKANEILDLLSAVFSTRVVDWVAAEAKTEEFRRIVNSAVSTVRATAMADNPIVGQQIAQRLNAASSQTNAAIGRAKEAIKAQTWTRVEAEALFGELQTILDGVQTDLRDQVNQLSPAAQEQIINTLNLARSQAEAKANEILDLLA